MSHPDPSSVGGEPSDPSDLSNADLLASLDSVLVKLERRLLRYAQVGTEVLQMADEGLVLAARTGARIAQAQSAVNHARNHLQIVGVGSWRPTSMRLTWEADPRITDS